MSGYDSDRPILKKNEDEFNRILFVQDFTSILSSLAYGENYIIGLSAKWGEGKTSAINLILDELETKDNFIPVYVSSWALRGDYEVILWDILDQTSKKISNKKNIKTKRARFGNLLNRISKAEIPFELNTEFDLNDGGRNETKVSSGKIINTISYVSQLLSSSDNIAKARKRIEDAITGKKVIVFVDDLDRLEGKQIIEILRALSTVADYGGMTYVLSFDKQYVSTAIAECLPKNQSGEDFLEKIIQVPIILPSLTQEMIDNNLITKINSLLSENDIVIEEDEIERFQRLYFFGANKYINSPRAVVRIINALRFRIPIVKDELNIVDSIILEIIRVFDEKFYETIRINAGLLINRKGKQSQNLFVNEDISAKKSEIQRVFNFSDDDLEIVKGLFPEINKLYDNFEVNNAEELRLLRRLASFYYFDSFFASIGGQSSVSNRRLTEILQQFGDPKNQLMELQVVVNQSNYDLALRVIIDNIELIKNKLNFSIVLLDLVDTFSNKYKSTGLGLTPFETVLHRINEILKKSEKPLEAYFAMLNHNFVAGRLETLPMLFREVDLSNQTENRKIINLSNSDVEEYRKRALTVIQDLASKDQVPIDEIDRSVLLYSYWLRFGKNKDEISSYIEKRVKTSNQAVDFLSQFLGKWSTMGKNDFHRSDFDMDTYKLIDSYVDPDYLYQLIVSDPKYNKVISVDSNTLPSFEESDSKRNISRIGNEKNERFRQVVAQRFIYYHRKMITDNQE